MAKPTRSFYDRAKEAWQERYPREKFTQHKLAALAGVRQPTTNDWKSGAPTIEVTRRLARALRVCVEWLYTEEGPKHPHGPESPLSMIWPELDDDKRSQIERFADFVKREK